MTDDGGLVFDRADTITVPNAISGSGSLAQAGTGTVILSGANSFSGGTTVTGGGLQGNTASIPGSVYLASADTNLTFNQATDGTYSGVVSGPGSLTKTGGGGRDCICGPVLHRPDPRQRRRGRVGQRDVGFRRQWHGLDGKRRGGRGRERLDPHRQRRQRGPQRLQQRPCAHRAVHRQLRLSGWREPGGRRRGHGLSERPPRPRSPGPEPAARWATPATTRSRTPQPSNSTSSRFRAPVTRPLASPEATCGRCPWPWAAATRSRSTWPTTARR